MAHAVMDLVNIPETLRGFQRLLRPGGLLYLTLNYDGLSCFLPQWEPEFEEMLVSRYHLSMDNRIIEGRSSGSSRSGRQLIQHLLPAKLPLIAVGNSDWIVFPQYGDYSRSEAFFPRDDRPHPKAAVAARQCRRSTQTGPMGRAPKQPNRGRRVDLYGPQLRPAVRVDIRTIRGHIVKHQFLSKRRNPVCQVLRRLFFRRGVSIFLISILLCLVGQIIFSKAHGGSPC
jgi:hypothetical protein